MLVLPDGRGRSRQKKTSLERFVGSQGEGDSRSESEIRNASGSRSAGGSGCLTGLSETESRDAAR